MRRRTCSKYFVFFHVSDLRSRPPKASQTTLSMPILKQFETRIILLHKHR
jgi:hypothetical protein